MIAGNRRRPEARSRRRTNFENRQHGIESCPTACGIPWQNRPADRWAGTIQQELPDHVIALGEDHLRRLIRELADYDNNNRAYIRLRTTPRLQPVEDRPSSAAKIIGLPSVGGLRYRDSWSEAA